MHEVYATGPVTVLASSDISLETFCCCERHGSKFWTLNPLHKLPPYVPFLQRKPRCCQKQFKKKYKQNWACTGWSTMPYIYEKLLPLILLFQFHIKAASNCFTWYRLMFYEKISLLMNLIFPLVATPHSAFTLQRTSLFQ